jgi:hypothetical protein
MAFDRIPAQHALGIGLAATGFRIPAVAVALAAHGYPLSENFQWLASTPALLMLGTAAAAEVLAYYIPGVDHALDVWRAPPRWCRRRTAPR